jgi:hypothetical protein
MNFPRPFLKRFRPQQQFIPAWCLGEETKTVNTAAKQGGCAVAGKCEVEKQDLFFTKQHLVR